MTLPETCMAAFTAVDLRGLPRYTLQFFSFALPSWDRAGVFLLNEDTDHLEIHCGVGIDVKLYEEGEGL